MHLCTLYEYKYSYVCTCYRMHSNTHIMYLYTHMYVYIYIYACVCMYVCAYKYIHIYTHTYIYIYVGVIYYTGMHIHPQAFPRRTSATQCSWTPEPCPASTTGAPSQRVSGGWPAELGKIDGKRPCWDDPQVWVSIVMVVPQFGIAFSWGPHNSNFTMLYGRYVELLTMVYKSNWNWGGTTL